MENRKKSLLFVIPSLKTGGAEKSLWGLLKYFNYEKYDVDVYPYAETGYYSSILDEHVNILADNRLYRDFYYENIAVSFKKLIRNRHIYLALLRILWGAIPYIYKLLHIDYYRNSVIDWYIARLTMQKNVKYYDAAIGYMEGGSNYYVSDCISADKKIGWIHTDYSTTHPNVYLDRTKLRFFDAIVTVSENSKREIVKILPELDKKIKIIPNVIDTVKIDNLKVMPAEKMLDTKDIKIVSVGRLVKLKGFDICVDAAAMLREDGINYQWYIIGDGPEKESLQNQIDNLDLHDFCFLTGATDNPYAYVYRADICVQMSSYEGRSLVIDEAQYLRKPIIASDIGSYRDMIDNGETGIIIDRDKVALYKAIKDLICEVDLRRHISENLKMLHIDDKEIVRKIECIIA